jgi:hypothetical protein
VHVDTSTHAQSLKPERLRWETNSLFPYLDNSEHIVLYTCGKTLDVEWEGRESPPLDRLLAYRRRDTDEIKDVTLPYMGGEEIFTENRDETREYFLGQLVNALHHPPRI